MFMAVVQIWNLNVTSTMCVRLVTKRLFFSGKLLTFLDIGCKIATMFFKQTNTKMKTPTLKHNPSYTHTTRIKTTNI